MRWPKNLKIKSNVPLTPKTTFWIGGAAQFFSQPRDPRELKALLLAAKGNGVPVFILGAGSNILVSDEGVSGLVIKLDAPYFKKICLEPGLLRVGGGLMLSQMIKFAQDKSLGGMEFLAGIPGSLGGALAMNAGCWGFSIASLVKEAQVMDYRGKVKILQNKQIHFAYRKSSLAKYIILSAGLKLKKSRRLVIKNNISEYLAKRRKAQDLSFPNAGCIFKNPGKKSAGMLIDACGLKGKGIGQAFVSERHANFILNKGACRAKDVLALMRIMKKQVKAKFKLGLQPEIKIWE